MKMPTKMTRVRLRRGALLEATADERPARPSGDGLGRATFHLVPRHDPNRSVRHPSFLYFGDEAMSWNERKETYEKKRSTATPREVMGAVVDLGSAFEETVAVLAQRLDRDERTISRLGARVEKVNWDERGVAGPSVERRAAMGHYFKAVLAAHQKDPDGARVSFGRASDLLGLDAKDLSIAVDPAGGYTVPTPLAAEVLRLAAAIAAVRPLARPVPMESKTRDYPTLGTKPSAGVHNEGEEITQAEPTFGQVTLNARRFDARAQFTIELLQDSILDIGDLLFQLYAESIAELEDAQALEGDGAGANFVGVKNAAGGGSVAVSGAPADLDKFVDALFGTLPLVAINDPSCAWVMQPKLWAKLLKLKDANDRYLLNVNPTAGAPLSLLGKPVRLTDQISITGGTGADTTAYVGAWGRGMLFGERSSLATAISDAPGWTTAKIALRVIQRTAILVAVPSAFVKLTGITLS